MRVILPLVVRKFCERVELLVAVLIVAGPAKRACCSICSTMLIEEIDRHGITSRTDLMKLILRIKRRNAVSVGLDALCETTA